MILMVEEGKAELLSAGPNDPLRLNGNRGLVDLISVNDHRGGMKLRMRGEWINKAVHASRFECASMPYIINV